YQEAVSANLAVQEAEPLARAVLLPDVNLQANTSANDLHGSGAGTGGYNSHGYTLSISQPVFRKDRWIKLRQATSSIKQSNAVLDAARQALIKRVADRYFDLLGAEDEVEYASKTRSAIAQQLNQAEQRFEVGLIAVTDVEEAKARHDLAVADEISAKNGIRNAQEALREITAQYHKAAAPLGERMPLVNPDPADIDQWTDTSLVQNRSVVAAQYGVETARDEIKRRNAGHYPTLDLVGSRTHSSSNGGTYGGSSTMNDSIGLQLNVPIYQGGGTQSSVRESRHLFKQATASLEQARRAAQRQTREAYLGVVDRIAAVKAMKQAVNSTETALKATEAGFEAGTRTTVDV
ncbi:MAG: TolC family outer membrane protein, partial [Gammaproteobacteria bacterium]|nr:TolC family outer membrane protein [Gammaproteobacteria bacterium]